MKQGEEVRDASSRLTGRDLRVGDHDSDSRAVLRRLSPLAYRFWVEGDIVLPSPYPEVKA